MLQRLGVKLLCVLFIAVSLLWGSSVYAALDLSVNPVEGGSAIRFSREDVASSVTHEVRVRITSNTNVQYQVYQQLVAPFNNERGVMLNRPVLLSSVVPGSNGSGTAYQNIFEPVNRSEQLLFTSSGTGLGDAFTIVYKVDAQNLADSGSFTGLIQYVLRPINGGERQTVQTNVFIESNAELSATVEGSTANHLIRIDTTRNAPEAYAKIGFNGNAGGILRVYQEFLTYPVNELNSQLDSGILKMVTSGGQQGDLNFQSSVEIPHNRVLVYKSSQSSDSFSVHFNLAPDKTALQKAGNYRGLVRFSFESEYFQKEFDLDVEIKISPLFEIVMTFPEGPISFPKLLLSEPPQIKVVDVKVNSNLGRPYTVIQKLGQMLSNEKGKEIAKGYFKMRQELKPGILGQVSSLEFKPVETGDQVIFTSDSRGSPAEFRVYYQLSPYADMQAGDYRSAIMYTLGEL